MILAGRIIGACGDGCNSHSRSNPEQGLWRKLYKIYICPLIRYISLVEAIYILSAKFYMTLTKSMYRLYKANMCHSGSIYEVA